MCFGVDSCVRVRFCFSINTVFLRHLTWGQSASCFSKRNGMCEPAACFSPSPAKCWPAGDPPIRYACDQLCEIRAVSSGAERLPIMHLWDRGHIGCCVRMIKPLVCLFTYEWQWGELSYEGHKTHTRVEGTEITLDQIVSERIVKQWKLLSFIF